jgi:hypothetical protein
MDKTINKAPAKACTLSGGVFEFGDNGENSKTHPIKMLARSSQVIEHWFWGRVVHDFAGMKMTKSKIPMDYCHNTDEILGYANHPEIKEDGLHLSGALIPFKDSDRATEVRFRADNGVPYEASINFSGDGIKVEYVDENQVATVNGQQIEGPLTIFREWPLRGVAVCPYGADGNTSSSFSEGEEITIETVKTQEVIDMATETAETVEAEQVEAPEAVETAELSSEETETTETETETNEPAADAEAAEFSVSEFSELVTEFGAEIASKVVVSGGGKVEAYRLKAEAAEAKAAELATQLGALQQSNGGSAAALSQPVTTKKKSIFSK